MTTLDLAVVTFNCAKNLISVPVFAAHLGAVLANGLPDVVAFSLQEVAPMTYGFLGGYFLAPYYARFEEALNLAAGSTTTYTRVHAANVGYTALLVFARDPTAINSLQTAEVGFGMAEMGNKGAVGARFVYAADGETELTLVATHLAAMEWNLPLRNSNWAAIVRGLTFEDPSKVLEHVPSQDGVASDEHERLLAHSDSIQRRLHELSVYRPSSHLFVAGDLNYRIASTSPPLGAVFPAVNVPRSDPAHWSAFLPLDQLTRERVAGRTMHGLSEAPVSFPPTYKYNILRQKGELTQGEFQCEDVPWEFAPHRWPAWTDRVLFLNAPPKLPQIEVVSYDTLPVVRSSDHRAVFFRARVPLVSPTDMAGAVADGDPRVRLPVEVDPEAWARRAAARRKEVVAGWSMWATTTWGAGGVVVVLGVLVWLAYAYR